MDSVSYVSNDHHAPLISHTPLYSPGPHPVLRLVSCLRSWRVWMLGSIDSVGPLPPLQDASHPASSASRCLLETLTSTRFLMTSDLSLGGGVWELAVERLSHGQSPLRMQRPPCPIHTPNTTPRPGHPISCFHQHPRRETTRRFHRQRASSTPTAHQHHHWQLLHSHEHEHRRVWEVSRRARCSLRGVQ
jgi:hypothetical protein